MAHPNRSLLRINVFTCACGTSLWLTTNAKPVCRVPGCGKQMALSKERVHGIHTRQEITRRNEVYGVRQTPQFKTY